MMAALTFRTYLFQASPAASTRSTHQAWFSAGQA